MSFTQTHFPGLYIFEPAVFPDGRGFFFESYNQRLFQANGINNEFVQDNQSYSVYGVIRGLHYQREPHAQAKLVRVLEGKILDVVVDLRKGSPTFGKNFNIELSSDNKKQLLVPRGFAHGFSVLSEHTVISYKCDQFYNKQSESGIIYNDPTLAINWQIPVSNALISEKDLVLPRFDSSIEDFSFNQ